MGKLYEFGAGTLYGISTAAGSTPHRFGALQDVTWSVDATTKELHSENQFPEDVARGTAKVVGTAKFARIDARLLAELYFNEVTVSGHERVQRDETGAPIAVTFHYTAANFAAPFRDLGARSGVTGDYYQRISTDGTGVPTAGQYNVDEATGIYTFHGNTGDDASIIVDYVYHVATGSSFVATNQQLGTAPTFEMFLWLPRFTKHGMIHFYRCMSSKLSAPTKVDDYVIQEFGFSAFADDLGNVVKYNFSEAA